jgi:hypothetical protein
MDYLVEYKVQYWRMHAAVGRQAAGDKKKWVMGDG